MSFLKKITSLFNPPIKDEKHKSSIKDRQHRMELDNGGYGIGKLENGNKEGNWNEYYEDGSYSFYKYKNGQLSGDSIEYYKNGRIHKMGFYHNNKKLGEWTEFDEWGDITDGRVFLLDGSSHESWNLPQDIKKHLMDNKNDGESKKYCDKCNKIQSIGKFKDGIPIGIHKVFDCDKHIVIESSFLDGYNEWETKYYYCIFSKEGYTEDKIKVIYRKKNDEIKQIYYSRTGVVLQENIYKEVNSNSDVENNEINKDKISVGKRDCHIRLSMSTNKKRYIGCKSFKKKNDDGTLHSDVWIKENEIIFKREYNENGTVKHDFFYENNIHVMTVKDREYHDTGEVLWEDYSYTYENPKINHVRWFHKNGQKYMDTSFKDEDYMIDSTTQGISEYGTTKWYDEDGKITKTKVH